MIEEPSFTPEEVVAFHPRFWLWPSTIQNGVPLPLTDTVIDADTFEYDIHPGPGVVRLRFLPREGES